MGILVFSSKQYKESDANFKEVEYPNLKIQQRNVAFRSKEIICIAIKGIYDVIFSYHIAFDAQNIKTNILCSWLVFLSG